MAIQKANASGEPLATLHAMEGKYNPTKAAEEVFSADQSLCRFIGSPRSVVNGRIGKDRRVEAKCSSDRV